MGIKQLYNDNLRTLPNEYGDVSVMISNSWVSTNFINTLYIKINMKIEEFRHPITRNLQYQKRRFFVDIRRNGVIKNDKNVRRYQKNSILISINLINYSVKILIINSILRKSSKYLAVDLKASTSSVICFLKGDTRRVGEKVKRHWTDIIEYHILPKTNTNN